MANPTRILVADEHAPVRGLIAKKPDWLVCAEAAYGKESVEIAKKSCPDLARLDIEMPRMNGIEAAKEILRICPATIILSDSSHDVSLFLAELKDIGVKGFGFKSRIGIDVIPTVQAVLNGESRFPS
jgi:DNA-binding NarL/FixJ family response regulator